jgi:hypothetical protein
VVPPDEAQALLMLEHLIESLELSLMGPHLEPFKLEQARNCVISI